VVFKSWYNLQERYGAISAVDVGSGEGDRGNGLQRYNLSLTQNEGGMVAARY
jgi:hypothetical protein